MVQPGTQKALLARQGHLPPRPVPLSGRIPPVIVRMTLECVLSVGLQMESC